MKRYSHHRHIISPLLTGMLRYRPLQDGQVFPASGATRIIDRHSSFYPIPVNAEATEFILIDAGMDVKGKNLRQFLAANNLDFSAVKAVFVTHDHSDHVGAIHSLPKTIKVYIGKEDEAVFEGKVGSQGPLPALFDKMARKHLGAIEGVTPEVIADNEQVTVGMVTIHAFATPGHTPGSMSYLVSQNPDGPYDLFVGDALDYKLNGTVANAAPPFSADLHASANSIVELGHEIARYSSQIQTVIPAHSGNGSVGAERAFQK